LLEVIPWSAWPQPVIIRSFTIISLLGIGGRLARIRSSKPISLTPCILRAAIAEYHIEAVFHFAASAYVGESVEQPRKYFQNNVVATLNLLNVMLDMDVKDVGLFIDVRYHGALSQIPIPESHPQVPVNPYGDSKLFIEKNAPLVFDRLRLTVGNITLLQCCRGVRAIRRKSFSGNTLDSGRN